MGGSPSPATSTQKTSSSGTSSTGPNAYAAGYFPGLYQTGANALAANQNTPIPTAFVAGENPDEASAIAQTLNIAPKLGQSGGALSDLATKIASGYFMNPQNDPNFQGAVTAALTPITQQLTEGAIPAEIASAIKGGGVGGGPSAYGGAAGGSSLDIDMGTILRNFGQTAANTTSTMAQNVYNNAMNLFQQAPGIAQGANAQLLAPATTTGMAGQQEQQYAQQAINNLLQQYQYQMNAPWQGVSNLSDLLTAGGYSQGTTSSAGTTDTTSMPSQPSTMTQILQGLTGAAGIAGSLFAGGPLGGASAASNIMKMLSGGGGGPGITGSYLGQPGPA